MFIKSLYANGNDLLLVAVLQAGLEDNFAEVQVSVVECPDLTKEPFQFPVKGRNIRKEHCILQQCAVSKIKIYTHYLCKWQNINTL